MTSNLPEGVEAVVKVVNIHALANDWAAVAGPQANNAGYFFVLEGAKAALGEERLCYLTRERDGATVLRSFDFGWSFRNPPANAWRHV